MSDFTNKELEVLHKENIRLRKALLIADKKIDNLRDKIEILESEIYKLSSLRR